MIQVWSDAELNEHWFLTQDDYKLLRSKADLSHLALALQLEHYQLGSVALNNSRQFFFNEINERLGRKTLNATEPKIILQHQ